MISLQVESLLKMGGKRDVYLHTGRLEALQSDSGPHMCKQSAPDATLTEEARSRLPPHRHTFSHLLIEAGWSTGLPDH